MILVLTTQSGDYSHPRVIDWLNYLGANYKIISGEAILTGKIKLSIQAGKLFCDSLNLTDSVSCVFFRRWVNWEQLSLSDDEELNAGLNKNMYFELDAIKEFLYCNLKHAIWLPDLMKTNINKLAVLEKAKEVGLKIPNYIVTNLKEELLFFMKSNPNVVTKAIGNFRPTQAYGNLVATSIYTKKISIELVEKLPNTFFPCLFQELIEKKHEYRVLFLNKKIYSVAIFSQEDKLTELDSRISSDGFESRLCPVQFNLITEQRIVALMAELGLNIACIDILHGISDEFVFLEVNPVGQIGGYSERGGLDFEKKIVEYLIEIDTNYENCIKARNK